MRRRSPSPVSRGVAIPVAILIAVVVRTSHASVASSMVDGDAATRGITGRIVVESEHGHVRGRPDLDLDSSILVRVASRTRADDGRSITELEFIGVDAGVFDLRESLVFEDGGSIERMPPLMIEIVSNLAIDAPSDVFLAEAPPASIVGGYQRLLVLVGAAWLLVPLLVVLRRWFRRSQPPPVVPSPPTVFDRLEPLIRHAVDRDLTVDERGRLELLLHAHWRARLGLADDPVEAVRRIREDPEAGRLLRRVESWLHAPDGRTPSAKELGELLAPYREPVPEASR